MESRSGAPALQPVLGGARRFFDWWRGELQGLVPGRVRRLLADTEAGVVLAQVEDGFQVLTEPPSRARNGAPETMPRAQALAALAEMAASRRMRSVGIRLPLGQVFERRVELPRAGREDLRRMLEFDLERATPFRAGDVYTASLQAGEAGTRGRQRMRQLVVKREAVDPLVADVRAAGLEPAYVDCWHGAPASGLAVNFLEAGAPAHSGLARHVTLPRMLGILVLALAGLAGALELSRYETALAEISARTAQVRTKAVAVRKTVAQTDAAVAALEGLQEMKLKQVPAVAIVEELSRILPDSVWLAELRIEDGVVNIAGLAKSGAALPSLFVDSALFTDAALTAPVTLDPRQDKERFSLRIRLKAAAKSQAPPTPAATGRQRS